jgi:hypothetical protein
VSGERRGLAECVAARLNRLLRLDPEAVENLVELRVPVRPTDPVVDTDVVVQESSWAGGPPTLGLLGVINTILAPTGHVVEARYSGSTGDESSGSHALDTFTVGTWGDHFPGSEVPRGETPVDRLVAQRDEAVALLVRLTRDRGTILHANLPEGDLRDLVAAYLDRHHLTVHSHTMWCYQRDELTGCERLVCGHSDTRIESVPLKETA